MASDGDLCNAPPTECQSTIIQINQLSLSFKKEKQFEFKSAKMEKTVRNNHRNAPPPDSARCRGPSCVPLWQLPLFLISPARSKDPRLLGVEGLAERPPSCNQLRLEPKINRGLLGKLFGSRYAIGDSLCLSASPIYKGVCNNHFYPYYS